MTKLKTILVALMATMTMAVAGGNYAVAPVAPVEPIRVVADKNVYVGVSTTIGESITSTEFDTFSSTGVGVQAGYTFYRNGSFETAVEGRYTTILGSFSNDFGDVSNYGVFLKPQYNFDAVSVYGLVGYSNVDNSITDIDGFAYGAGVSTPVFANTELFVDYVTNDDSSLSGNFDNEVITVGMNYRF